MRFLKIIIFTSALFYSYSLKASEVTVIELHQNKSLDQLVLEQEKNEKNISDVDNAIAVAKNLDLLSKSFT